MRNKRPDLNGVLVIDKPLGWTSADVCRFVRSRTGGAKVGHAGTLDPLATGVLVVCLGSATKAIPGLMDGAKRYEAVVDLSCTSPTDDAEGPVSEVSVATPPTRDEVEAAAAGFVGRIMQTPPSFSAIKVGGERAYRRSRAGKETVLEARPVDVHSIRVAGYEWPLVRLEIECGKGTYIRSIARDLGARLGVGGMLRALRRTRVGPYGIEDSQTPEVTLENLTSLLRATG